MTAVLDHGYVDHIESWGSDERVIEAARMSTNKGFQGWGGEPCHCRRWVICDNYHSHSEECIETRATALPSCKTCGSSGYYPPGDEKLLRYLWENKHHTPFEMAGATFEVQAPIFVFREWHRHRTQSYNEMSARYTEVPERFYVPSVERMIASQQSSKNKQGSEDGLDEYVACVCRDEIANSATNCFIAYNTMIKKGVSREVARLVLPVNTYSRMRASANLRNWLAFLSLRMEKSAQWEIRQFADAVHSHLKVAFPRTVALFDAR